MRMSPVPSSPQQVVFVTEAVDALDPADVRSRRLMTFADAVVDHEELVAIVRKPGLRQVQLLRRQRGGRVPRRTAHAVQLAARHTHRTAWSRATTRTSFWSPRCSRCTFRFPRWRRSMLTRVVLLAAADRRGGGRHRGGDAPALAFGTLRGASNFPLRSQGAARQQQSRAHRALWRMHQEELGGHADKRKCFKSSNQVGPEQGHGVASGPTYSGVLSLGI